MEVSVPAEPFWLHTARLLNGNRASQRPQNVRRFQRARGLEGSAGLGRRAAALVPSRAPTSVEPWCPLHAENWSQDTGKSTLESEFLLCDCLHELDWRFHSSDHSGPSATKGVCSIDAMPFYPCCNNDLFPHYRSGVLQQRNHHGGRQEQQCILLSSSAFSVLHPFSGSFEATQWKRT